MTEYTPFSNRIISPCKGSGFKARMPLGSKIYKKENAPVDLKEKIKKQTF